MYLTGFHAIEEQIKAGSSGLGPLLMGKAGPRAREIMALARSRNIAVERVGTIDLDRIDPKHKGIALFVPDLGSSDSRPGGNETSVENFIASLDSRPGKDALVLILDEITDPHNYGAILRSCDQFGADLVISRKRRNAANAPVIAQTSAGASAWVPFAEVPNLPRVLEALKEAGFWIFGADMDGEPLWEKDFRGKVALIIGGEAGLSRLLREACDGIIAIPTKGRIDSLNVSVASGIMLYEATRQKQKRAQ